MTAAKSVKHRAPKIVEVALREAVAIHEARKVPTKKGTRFKIDSTEGNLRVKCRFWVGYGKKHPWRAEH